MSLDGYLGVPASVVEDRHWLGIISAPEQKIQRTAVAGKNFWPGADACCGYIIGLHAGLGYLVWYQCQLRASMPPIGVLGCICSVEV